MFVNFSEETKHLLKQAEKEKEELNHPYVGSEHLFLAILKEDKNSNIFKKYNLTYNIFKNKLVSLVGVGSKKSEFNLYTPLLKRVIENAVIEAREEINKSVSPDLLIISILDEEDGIAYTILKSLKVNLDKLYIDIRSKKNNKPNRKKKLLLEELGVDLVKQAKEKKLDPVIGREREIQKTLEILLRRKKNNPLLIGPAGVGKTAIVEGLANLMNMRECPRFLKDKRIIALNIFQLVSGTKYRGEFEEKMKNLIKELEENKDIILFIDEIHTIVGAGGAEGAIDASNIFKPALARGTIRIIGATTLDEYKKFIEPDAALSRRFQSVIVEEPSTKSVINILTKIKPLYEDYHNVFLSSNLINDIVMLSERYLTNRYEPDRSIDILDEVCARVSSKESNDEKRKKDINRKIEKTKKEKLKALAESNFKKACVLKKQENDLNNMLNKIKSSKKIVSKKDIIEVVKNKGNLSYSFMDEEKNRLYERIEKELKDTIYGCDDNINKLIKSLRKKDILKKKSCYSILINGSSGSGKTYFAQNILKYLVNEKNIIRLDASEYQEHHMISKLIGATAGYLGYDNKNNLFEKVRTNPSSALIIENFDEGCLEFKNLFTRILELGYIEDASGKKIDFTSSFLIFITDNYNQSDSLGFSKNKLNLDYNLSNLESKVSLVLNMKKPNDDVLERIIDKKIDEITNKYREIIINYDDKLKKDVFNKIKDKNIALLDSIIENEFELKIVDAILDNKKKIDIKLDEESIV